MAKKRISFSAFKVESGINCFYVAVIPGKKLYSISEVSRAHEDPEIGYQRHLAENRAKKIAYYIDNGNLIPGSIVMSAQQSAVFKYSEKTEKISFIDEQGSFFVIDGQHRLYGAHLSQQDPQFVVTIFDDLELQGEVQYFLDVNSTQRGVPKTLQLEILKFSEPEESQELIRINLFKELNTNPRSPLCGKMSATKSVVGKLTHVPFQKAIDPLFKMSAFNQASTDQKAKLLMNFLNAIDEVLKEIDKEDRLTNTAFFRSLFISFREVLNISRLKYGDYKTESIRKVIEPLKDIVWEAHTGTNNAAIVAFAGHIVSLIEGEEISDSIL
jgi:DNA sulfur modification protein DndB